LTRIDLATDAHGLLATNSTDLHEWGWPQIAHGLLATNSTDLHEWGWPQIAQMHTDELFATNLPADRQVTQIYTNEMFIFYYQHLFIWQHRCLILIPI
jgi:hypothetical protein